MLSILTADDFIIMLYLSTISCYNYFTNVTVEKNTTNYLIDDKDFAIRDCTLFSTPTLFNSSHCSG